MRVVTALWTGQEIAQATGGTLHGDFVAEGVTFDSREVTKGDLFIAMVGENQDGHRYVAGAFEAGAAGCLVSQAVDGPHVLVDDTFQALQALGRAARGRVDACIIGVTGSVGKTSTKEALAAALDRTAPGKTHWSVKSYNNHTGVPLSLARMPRDTRYAILEMGMNHEGEIRALTTLVRPHAALITAIAPAHIENLGTIEAIADAKAEIFEGLEGQGIAIVPDATPHRDRLLKAAKKHASILVTFGPDEDADVHVVHAVPVPGGGSLITAVLRERELTFTVSQPGDHWVSNALAVLATVEAVNGDVARAGVALAELGDLVGRGKRHRVKAGNGSALLVDESYNANSASMAATLKALGAEKDVRRRIAVLGPMRELGEQSDALHEALAEPIGEAGIDQLILIGHEFDTMVEKLGGAIPVIRVADAAAATDALLGIIYDGDAVLVKASNSIGLAKLVERLTKG